MMVMVVAFHSSSSCEEEVSPINVSQIGVRVLAHLCAIIAQRACNNIKARRRHHQHHRLFGSFVALLRALRADGRLEIHNRESVVC